MLKYKYYINEFMYIKFHLLSLWSGKQITIAINKIKQQNRLNVRGADINLFNQ